MNRLFFFVALAAILASSLATANEIKVSYISKQNIYIDAGKADGIWSGDSVIVKQQDSPVALLKIQYAADHSASAILKKGKMPKVGDVIVLLVRHKIQKMPKKNETRTRAQQTRQSARRSNFENRTKISGSISFNWYRIQDQSSRKMTFDQPGARVNIKIKNLFGKGYELRIKNRLRYQKRSYTYGDRLPEDQWRNRLYTVSFSYKNPSSVINYQIGRVLANTIGSIGYIDGALVQANVSPFLHVGLFGGTQLDRNDYPSGVAKYGLFAQFQRGDYRSRRWETALALSGEYVGNIVDRELVYMMNSFSTQKLSIYQSADIDINRAWRQQRAGENMSLSNLYVNGTYRVSRALSFGFSYDSRKNYYSYQWRSIADSLFDDAMRYGTRGSINVRLPRHWSIMANAGARLKQGEQQTSTSFAASIRKSNITPLRLFLGLYGSGFSNNYTQGNHASVRLGANLKSGHSFDVSYGGYYYTASATRESRKSQWIRSNINLYLGRHWYVMQSYEYFWGDDAPGHRIFVEAGYRL